MKVLIQLYITLTFLLLSFNIQAQKDKSKYEQYKKVAKIRVQNDSLPNYIISVKKELELAKQKNEVFKIAENSLFLSKLYYKLSSFDIAIDYNIEALKLFEQVKDTIYMIYALQNISAMYGYVKNDSASIEYSLKNLELSKQIKDTIFMEGAYINLATSYMRIDSEKSFEYYNKAIKSCNKTNHNKGLVFIYNNIGTYYYSKNNLDSAKYYFTKSLYSIENKENNVNTAVIYSNIAETDYYLGDYEEAILNSRKSIEYFKNKNMVTNAANSYQILIKSLTKIGKTDSIEIYLDKYIKIQKETISKKRVEQTAKLKILYDINKFETKIKLLTSENKLKQSELTSSRLKLYLATAISVLTLIILIIIIIQSRRITKSHKKIVDENIKSIIYEEENSKLKNVIIDKNIKITNNSNREEQEEKNSIENELYSKVIKYLELNKSFKSPDFSLGVLAKELNTNRTYISQAINIVSSKTFTEIVNDYRILEAKKLLYSDKTKQLTIEAIGKEAGFNSRSTFFRVFKSITGVTPSFFMKNIGFL